MQRTFAPFQLAQIFNAPAKWLTGYASEDALFRASSRARRKASPPLIGKTRSINPA
jgi:hypothetical protein